jgi:hypothetical protein
MKLTIHRNILDITEAFQKTSGNTHHTQMLSVVGTCHVTYELKKAEATGIWRKFHNESHKTLN